MKKLSVFPALLEAGLSVRWVPRRATRDPDAEAGTSLPVAGEAALESLARTVGEAARLIDRMETEEALTLLSEAEKQARSFRVGDTTRPYLAEIFLRRGLLYLWEGRTEKAEEMFVRSRALRPEFVPDPAMFSPPFLESWKRSAESPPRQAELFINSFPPGAMILLDGKEAGTTPSRVRLPASGPVHIRIRVDGYRDMETTGEWLPGDTDALDFSLVRDNAAVLSDLVSSSFDGREAGSLLSSMEAESGATRVLLLVLEERNGRQFLRIVSHAQGEETPRTLGSHEWRDGDGGDAEAGEFVVRMLRDAGWPAEKENMIAGPPWYHKWWIWTFIGVAAAGIAAGMGGGGGSSGSSTGTIGVNF